MPNHEHSAAYYPASGTGYQVCECGDVRRVEEGEPMTSWHRPVSGWRYPGLEPMPEPNFRSAVSIGRPVLGDAVWDRPEPEPEEG